MSNRASDTTGALGWSDSDWPDPAIEARRSTPRAVSSPRLSEAERDRLLLAWNQTDREYPRDVAIHEIFTRQAERTPEAIAAVFQDRQLTYRQLNEQTNQVAHYLHKSGVRTGALVGLCVDRSLDILVGMLGILKAGGAYVPLDPEYPAERLAFMLRDTGAALVVTQQKFLEALSGHSVGVVCLDRDAARIAAQRIESPTANVTGDDLAYVIYTSGSTGIPKGVQVVHRGIARLVFGNDYAKFGPDRIFLQLATTSFDASTFEIWGPLLHGGRCVIYPDRMPTAAELGRALREHNVTTLWLTSSLFNLIIDQDASALASLDELLIGGEALSPRHVRRALELLSNTTIINGYGPTECTTFACCYRIPRPLDPRQQSIPIGRPIGNTRIYILNDQLQPVAIGEEGQLYIAGDGLARDYLNRLELTAAAFIADPFGRKPGDRMYKTGDRCRYLPDGNIEFLGRIDHQIKIHGYRVELGEIEAALGEHPAVQRSAVVLRLDEHGDKRLIAYIVPAMGAAPSVSELRNFLRRKLPEHMVPSLYVTLSDLPLTQNGKVDDDALPAPQPDPPEQQRRYQGPRDPEEAMMADIWSAVLERRQLDIDDDFFDLGGHSLLAIRLCDEIAQQFDVIVPVNELLSSPTIAKLTRTVMDRRFTTLAQPIIALRATGTKPPIFFFPGLGSDVISFMTLTRLLDEDQPVYALQLRGLDGTQPPHERIEEMAAYFIEQIRKVSPSGPYYLAGFSAGALIAYEISQQLARLGEKTAMLALLDMEAPGWLAPRAAPTSRINLHLKVLQTLKGRDARAYVLARVRGIMRRVLLLEGRVSKSKPAPFRAVYTAYQRAIESYVLVDFTGNAAIVSSRPADADLTISDEPWITRYDDPYLGWGRFIRGEVSFLRIPGNDHLQMIRPPGAQRVAARLRELISKALSSVANA